MHPILNSTYSRLLQVACLAICTAGCFTIRHITEVFAGIMFVIVQVIHQPPLTFESGFDAEESCSYVDDLSLEYLIHRSICARSIHLLNQIKEILRKHIKCATFEKFRS